MPRLDGESIYRRVSVRLHTDEKVRRLSKPQPCGKALWYELLFGEQTDVVPGLFRIGEAGFAEQLEWPLKGFREAWKEIQDAGLPVHADWGARLVWVQNALHHNMPASPNVVRAWKDCWRDRLPDCELKEEAKAYVKASLKAFGEAWAKAFDEVCTKPLLKPSAKVTRTFEGKASPNQEAVSSKQLPEKESSKLGSKEGAVDNCPPIPESVSDSDRSQFLRLWTSGKAAEAQAFLAKAGQRKGSEPQDNPQLAEVAT